MFGGSPISSNIRDLTKACVSPWSGLISLRILVDSLPSPSKLRPTLQPQLQSIAVDHDPKDLDQPTLEAVLTSDGAVPMGECGIPAGSTSPDAVSRFDNIPSRDRIASTHLLGGHPGPRLQSPY